MKNVELSQHFSGNLFKSSLTATTKDEAISELLDLFVESKIIRNKKIVLDMLHQRETLGSTGIGKGIAIPHGRTIAASDVMIAFGISKAGIEYDAIDGKPVNLFFMVIAPPHDENNNYLPILGSLVTILKDNATRKKLEKVETFEEFFAIIAGE